jgi:flavin-dependent thymidylate synthase
MSDSTEVSTYVDKSMYPAAPMRSTYPEVKIISATPDPLGCIAAAAGIYTGRILTPQEVTDEERAKCWNDMMATALTAALEFVNLHIFIEGCTRAFTHQLVRQRTAVYCQESMRFAVKEDMHEACQLPPSLAMRPRSPAHTVWEETLKDIENAYDFLIANGIPAEDARGLLPTAITTRIHYGTDLRNLMQHVANRTCTQAQFEWRHYVTSLRKALVEKPVYRYACRYRDEQGIERIATNDDRWQWELIAKHLVQPPCFRAGHCTFKASFDRPCTIRDRVEANEFDKIEETDYLLDPQAAWARS